MRTTILFLLAAVAFISQGTAEERVIMLPEIVVGGARSSSVASDRCVEVEIGSSRALDCLNQKLKQQVDRVNPSMNIAPIDAKSQDIKVGIVNMPGVQQQYGRNFGVSVVPYRPAPPVFTSPLGPGR